MKWSINMLKRLIGKTNKNPPVSLQKDEEVGEVEAKIWRETGLPKKEFLKTYAPLLQNIEEITGGLSGERGGEFYYKQLLREIFYAVKVRNAFIFPVSAKPEEIIHKAEAYTYALVTGMALHALSAILSTLEGKGGSNPIVEPRLALGGSGGIRKGFDGAGLLLANNLIPKEGLCWLYQHEDVFLEWVTFVNTPEGSVFYEIYGKVKKFGGTTLSEGEPPVNEAHEKNAVEPTTKVMEPKETEKADIGRVPKGWNLVSALREAVGSGELTVNASDSYIFLDEQKRTLLVPDELFKWLGEKRGIKSNTAKNQFCRLGLHCIKQNKKTYYEGITEKGVSVKGLLIDDHKGLWGEVTPPSCGITLDTD